MAVAVCEIAAGDTLSQSTITNALAALIDAGRAHRVAGAMQTGMVWINAYKRVSPASPFGGVRGSGYGREMGFEAMHEYTQPKSVWVKVDATLPVWYPPPGAER